MIPDKTQEDNAAEKNNKKTQKDKENKQERKNNKKSNDSKSDNKKSDSKRNKDYKDDKKKNKKKNTVIVTDSDNKQGDKNDTTDKEPLKNIKMTLNQLVQMDENSGKQADLGGIKSRLQLKYPGFDEHNYGYNSIRELIDNETKFSVIQEGNQAYVISDKKGSGDYILELVCGFILDCYPNKVIGKHEVGGLGRKLKGKFPEFDYKDYGYSKLSLFLEEIGMKLY